MLIKAKQNKKKLKKNKKEEKCLYMFSTDATLKLFSSAVG
jgi:hypothetical protein